MMGDMGEVFNAMKKASQEKRARNRDSSPQMLEDAGVKFEEKNAGAHLIVDGDIDFWPGTGLWIVRPFSKRRRGVKSLIKYVRLRRTK